MKDKFIITAKQTCISTANFVVRAENEDEAISEFNNGFWYDNEIIDVEGLWIPEIINIEHIKE